ncbi:hypothetical protein [Paenibacillus sp. FSL L8-0709]|uniref:hypothetical protein n=1 Tax=Paenibacillus sp. FSL L8-0709 TaxID=2975312 RepID=UPI0030FBDB77
MGYENKWPTDEQFATFDEDDKRRFYADYYRGGYAYAGHKPTFKQKMKYTLTPYLGYLIGIIGIIIVYVVINLVLVGGQNLWHSGENNRLDELETIMSSQEKIIQSYENQVDNGTISDDEYNEYTKKVDEYNKNVNEYNEVAEKAGTTWYILPVPGTK